MQEQRFYLADDLIGLNATQLRIITHDDTHACCLKRAQGSSSYPSFQELKALIHYMGANGQMLDKLMIILGAKAQKCYEAKDQGQQEFPSFHALQPLLELFDIESIELFISKKARLCYLKRVEGNYAYPSFQELQNLINNDEAGQAKARILISSIAQNCYNHRYETQIPNKYPNFKELQKLNLNLIKELLLSFPHQSIRETLGKYLKHRFIACFQREEDNISFNPEGDLFGGIIGIGLSSREITKLTNLGQAIISAYQLQDGNNIDIGEFINNLPNDGKFQIILSTFIECINTFLRIMGISEIQYGLSIKHRQGKEIKSFVDKIEKQMRENIDIVR